MRIILEMCDEKRVIAIDVSGSTGGCAFYFDRVARILEDFYRAGDEIILWAHTAEYSTKKKTDAIVRGRKGSGGTSPGSVVSLLRKTHVEHLVLVTDGCVSASSVEECDAAIRERGLSFGRVSAFIIGRPEHANLSITCPFTRACPFSVRSEEHTSEL